MYLNECLLKNVDLNDFFLSNGLKCQRLLPIREVQWLNSFVCFNQKILVMILFSRIHKIHIPQVSDFSQQLGQLSCPYWAAVFPILCWYVKLKYDILQIGKVKCVLHRIGGGEIYFLPSISDRSRVITSISYKETEFLHNANYFSRCL